MKGLSEVLRFERVLLSIRAKLHSHTQTHTHTSIRHEGSFGAGRHVSPARTPLASSASGEKRREDPHCLPDFVRPITRFHTRVLSSTLHTRSLLPPFPSSLRATTQRTRIAWGLTPSPPPSTQYAAWSPHRREPRASTHFYCPARHAKHHEPRERDARTRALRERTGANTRLTEIEQRNPPSHASSAKQNETKEEGRKAGNEASPKLALLFSLTSRTKAEKPRKLRRDRTDAAACRIIPPLSKHLRSAATTVSLLSPREYATHTPPHNSQHLPRARDTLLPALEKIRLGGGGKKGRNQWWEREEGR